MTDEQQTDWKESLPESVQNWDEARNAENPEQFWQRITDQRTHLGNSIRIPTEEAGDDQWQEFHQKILERVPALMRKPSSDDESAVDDILKALGKPDATDKYVMPESDDIAFNEGQDKWLKEIALEAGLTKKQFKKIATNIGKRNYVDQNTYEEQTQNELKRIANEWGLSAEEKYKHVLNFAKSANAPQSLVDAIENRKIDAETVFWLEKMQSSVSDEGSPLFKKDLNHPSGLSPYEAQQRINDMLNNPDHSYHKGDPIARKRMHELMQATKGVTN